MENELKQLTNELEKPTHELSNIHMCRMCGCLSEMRAVDRFDPTDIEYYCYDCWYGIDILY